MLKIVDKLPKDTIFESVDVKTKPEAMDFIADKIAAKSSFDKNIIKTALEKREAEESTGVGRGIAIPHGRIKGFGQIGLFAFMLKNDIDFEALDHENVSLIFALVADDDMNDEYVKVLSRLIFLISQKSMIAKVVGAKSGKELLDALESARELESKFETEGQIKYLIELQRADTQIYMYELWESSQKNQNETIIEEYKKYRENLEKKINPEVLGLYNRIKEKYSGRALAKVENYTCSGCHIAIPKVTVNEIRRQNQIITCFSCGRILFTTD